jgi:hypothetical protein
MVDLAQIVDTVRVIGMFVRPQNRVDCTDVRREKLFAHVGPGIHEDRSGVAADQDGGARSPVAGIGRIAGAPIAPDPRHAG